MGTQREMGGGFAEMTQIMRAIKGAPLSRDDRYSGTQFENFREGWAHEVNLGAHSRVAHYFKRRTDDIGLAVSKCGRSIEVRHVYGAGNYERCGRCRNVMARRVG